MTGCFAGGICKRAPVFAHSKDVGLGFCRCPDRGRTTGSLRFGRHHSPLVGSARGLLFADSSRTYPQRQCSRRQAQDGRHALSASADRTLRPFWDLHSSSCLCVLQGHTGSVRAVRQWRRCTLRGLGFRGQNPAVVGCEKGTCLRTLEGHTDRVNALALSGDGRQARCPGRLTARCGCGISNPPPVSVSSRGTRVA